VLHLTETGREVTDWIQVGEDIVQLKGGNENSFINTGNFLTS